MDMISATYKTPTTQGTKQYYYRSQGNKTNLCVYECECAAHASHLVMKIKQMKSKQQAKAVSEYLSWVWVETILYVDSCKNLQFKNHMHIYIYKMKAVLSFWNAIQTQKNNIMDRMN